MEIREFTTYHEKAPSTGFGIWIVLEEKDRKAHLLHPVHLTELIVSEYDYVRNVGAPLWPTNASGSKFSATRFIDSFKHRIAFFLENGRSFPLQTVAKALAAFEEISHEQAIAFIGSLSVNEFGESISNLSNKANREYAVKDNANCDRLSPRAMAIVEVLKENGPASIYQLTSLVDGKLKTKSDVSRVVTFFVNKLASQGILEIVT